MLAKKLRCYPNLTIIDFDYLVQGFGSGMINQIIPTIILTLKKIILEKYQMPRWGKQKNLITKQTWNVTIQF
jgi:hypothetical protein